MQFVIITGMSGSGKSSCVDVLEDLGYYCIDNMPPELIGKFVDICNQSESKIDKVAFVIDIRSGELFLKLKDTLENLRHEDVGLKLIFLDCSDDVIISQAMADYYIDTTNTRVNDFRERMREIFSENTDYMRIDVRSFGFKFGYMPEGDLVFDVRCLPNPFYVPELKNLTGLNPEVYTYVMKFDQSKILLDKLCNLVDFLIPLYEKEGKAQLVIAFGCTGGKHRSVAFAEAMAHHLRGKNHKIRIQHRDIEKR